MTAGSPIAPSTPYLAIGGEIALRALVRRFYALMDTQPETYAIRKLHPVDLSTSEENQLASPDKRQRSMTA